MFASTLYLCRTKISFLCCTIISFSCCTIISFSCQGLEFEILLYAPKVERALAYKSKIAAVWLDNQSIICFLAIIVDVISKWTNSNFCVFEIRKS